MLIKKKFVDFFGRASSLREEFCLLLNIEKVTLRSGNKYKTYCFCLMSK